MTTPSAAAPATSPPLRSTGPKPAPEAHGARPSRRTAVAAAPATPERRNPARSPRSEPFPAAQSAASPPLPYREEASSADSAPSAGAPSSKQLASPVAAAKATTAAEARGSHVPERAVEDWIKRIRELNSEGRFDDAAKELAAFRAAYGKRAESLLPPDLRSVSR
jgi:hypothetical protein